MASGGGNKKKSSDGSGGNLLGFLGGAVLGAAVAYGVKKAYDYFNDEQNAGQTAYSEQPCQASTSSTKKKCFDEDSDSEYAAAAAMNTSRPSTSSDSAAYKYGDSNETEGSALLHEFYQNYVRIEEAELSQAREVVNHILQTFNRYINQNHSTHFPIGPMFINNVDADLLVVKPDHYIVHIPIHLDPKMWEVMDGENTSDIPRGYCLIKRKVSEAFAFGASPFDRHLLMECLSPIQLNLKLQETIECVSWGSPFRVHAVMKTELASVVVEYAANKQVHIEFLPIISLETQSFISELHPKAYSNGDYQNLWKKSFLAEEEDKLREISQSEGYQLQCLLIFLALPNSTPAYFGLLKKDVLKTVFFHLVDCEDIWYEETLMERFIDMLKSLEEYLRVRKLPDYFNPYMDILEPYPHNAMDNLRSFISKTIGQNQFKWLLKRPN